MADTEHDESAGSGTELLETLVEMHEFLQTLIEFAEGQRAEMVRRGWSSAAAELYASEVLCVLVRSGIR